MPKRPDLKKILVVGAGPIVIGQACEFDYSGTQVCKALKSEGIEITLINSNPATIMTDPETADNIYIEPITLEFLEKVIAKERPDAILPTVGGQTALNISLQASEAGILKKYNVEMIGAKAESIQKAENRELFNKAMSNIGLQVPNNAIVNSMPQAQAALDQIGLPAIIRPAFTLGGSGGGIAETEEEYFDIVKNGLDLSPISQVQIDQSLLGWKEYEMEVVRDQNDNTIIICSIENIDPMGIHTGDSITVAPALTLTDKEYQKMRNASIAVLREIGIETGGSNVQFAVNPKNGDLVVIEMNPRVSRSSALASKATGFPIAKIAAKLAIGYNLDEIQNDITRTTPASFEPTIDYIVTKIPRFTFEKFSSTNQELTSSMKSVGEVMAIGRSFNESIQKALCSLEIGLTGFDKIKFQNQSEDKILKELQKFSPNRIIKIAQAIRENIDFDKIIEATKFDPWFVREISKIVASEKELEDSALPTDYSSLLQLKKMGFSDAKLAELCKISEKEVRECRYKIGLLPVYKKVDSCAAEFQSFTNYMYSCYEGDFVNTPKCEANISSRNKIIILGGGPNRIGQGIEFDYACVHAAYALRELDIETIMVNCNPETVSTDYDTSDRLYFEPLTPEHVIELAKKEQSKGKLLGVIVQFGGQTPLQLAEPLREAGIPIIGTSPDMIDLAEDRQRFKEILNRLKLKQPRNAICQNINQLRETVNKIGYPVVIRPSYVLGGRAMQLLDSDDDLTSYLDEFQNTIKKGAILIDSFLSDAIELDVDVLADGEESYVAGVMEHVEYAGIHSGDSACSLPPYSINQELIDKIIYQSKKLAKALNIIGLMNIQYSILDGDIYILEVNPRASRTVPFVAKSIGIPLAKIAAQLMAGKKLTDFNLPDNQNYGEFFSVKEAVFPFEKFNNVDVLLGPEMKSTGEVMGRDKLFIDAFAKSQIAIYGSLPKKGTVFISVKDSDKKYAVNLASMLSDAGFKICATKGTAEYLQKHNISNCKLVNKVTESSDNIVTKIKNNTICLVLNTTEGKQSIKDSFSIRRETLLKKTPYSTTIRHAQSLVSAICRLSKNTELKIWKIN